MALFFKKRSTSLFFGLEKPESNSTSAGSPASSSFPNAKYSRILPKKTYHFLADSSIALINISTCSLPEMTKSFVILEAAIINTSFVSMVLPLQFILLYLYFIILYRLMQQIFHEFFITYFSAVTVHRPMVIS